MELSVEEMDQKIDVFLQSSGKLNDIGEFIANEKLAQRFFARFKFLPESQETAIASGIEGPHCHGRDANRRPHPQIPCPVIEPVEGVVCHGPMKLRSEPNKTGFRCYKSIKVNGEWKKCGICLSSNQGTRFREEQEDGTFVTGAEGSMTFGAKIPANQLFQVMWGMCVNLNWSHLKDITDLSGEVLTNYTTLIKEVMMRTVYRAYDLPDGKIGGPGEIVEIDETKIAKRKSNTGQILANELEWVFGGIGRYSKQAFKVRVTGRSIRDLIPLMKRFINPGSIIVSDGWSAYTLGLPAQNQWSHFWVNHSTHFVAPNQVIHGANHAPNQQELVHTQVIERHWGDLKACVKVYSNKNGAIDRELAAHTYMCNYFGRGVDKILPRERLVKLTKDCGIIYPAGWNNGAIKELPDWVMLDPSQQTWTNLTGSTKVLKGFNVLGLEYEGVEDAEMPDNHWHDFPLFNPFVANANVLGADDVEFP